MGARQGDLERPSRDRLPADLGEVHARRLPGPLDDRCVHRARRSGPRSAAGPPGGAARDRGRPEHLRGLCNVGHRDRLQPRSQRRLRDGLRRHDDATHARRPQRQAHRQDPRHPANLAAEAELPDQGHPSLSGSHLVGSEQDPHRDREIQRRAGLPELRRGEVHRDPPRRVVEARVPERAADALPCLGERCVRETDDREPGQTGRHVNLDANDASRDALERG